MQVNGERAGMYKQIPLSQPNASRIGAMAAIDDRATVPFRRMEALRQANDVRRQRAEIKHALCSGTASIVELLVTPPAYLMTAKLAQILLAVPGYGQVRVNRLLKRCGISPLKTIGSLSERQREELAQALAGACEVPG
jgi:hypothetical protein